MKPIKAKKDLFYKETFYAVGDIIKIQTKEDLIKLNEKGFIEPLTLKEIQEFGKEEPKRNFKEEVE